jgi:hypothetical protein
LTERTTSFGLGLVDDEIDGPTDHQRRERLLINVGRRYLRNGLSPSHDHDAVCYLEGLAEFVADEDDPLAVGLELVDNFEEPVDLGWGQNGCRFIENDETRLAFEDLYDLDPLLKTDGQILDNGIGVDIESIAAGYLGDRLPRLAVIQNTETLRRLVTQHHIFGHSEDRHQHEMLVDHADPCSDGITGRFEVQLFAVDEDLA